MHNENIGIQSDIESWLNQSHPKQSFIKIAQTNQETLHHNQGSQGSEIRSLEHNGTLKLAESSLVISNDVLYLEKSPIFAGSNFPTDPRSKEKNVYQGQTFYPTVKESQN